MRPEEMKKKYGRSFIGNVIRIVDKRTIIVNVGKGYLEIGNVIQVYEPGEMLKNIDGRDLCTYDFVKDELEVVRVETLYAVCQKMKSTTKTFKSISFALSPLLEHAEIEYIPLKIDENDIQELGKLKDPIIRIGDPIKLA